MSHKILFTCVGGSDPVRGLHDGAMLHIIRHYLPEKVYIVLSDEMKKLHEQDDRYNKAIQKFCKDFHHDIDVKFLPFKIQDVSDFDAFDKYFQEQLSLIMKDNPQDELLLNISSGSPQMNFTMCLLATNIKFKKSIAIQVKTAEKSSNKSDSSSQKKYDWKTEIELNEDNLPNSENRCTVPPFFAMKKALVLKQVQALLENYEYSSAENFLTNIGITNAELVPMVLLKHLVERQNLKTVEAEKLLKGQNFEMNLMPIANGKCREETEFLLILQNLCKTNKITEFTLRLNPFIIRMQELYLLKKFHFDCLKIKTKYKLNIFKLSRDKIQKEDKNLLNQLDKNFKDGFKDASPSIAVYNCILVYMNQKRSNAEATNYISFFKKCEEINNERNSAAHSLYGMDEVDLQKINMSSSQIVEKCKKLLVSCYGKECNSEIFDIYDRVNNLIMENL